MAGNASLRSGVIVVVPGVSIVTLLVAISPAKAAPLLDATLQIQGSLSVGSQTSGDPVGTVNAAATGASAIAGIALDQSFTYSTLGTNVSGGGAAAGSARAQLAPGLIKLSASATADGSGTGQASPMVTVDADARIEGDCTFSGPGSTVSGSFSLIVDGLVDTAAVHTGVNRTGAGLANANATFDINAGFQASPGSLSTGHLQTFDQVTSAGVVTGTTSNSGLLTGYTGGSTVLTIPITNMPVGVTRRWQAVFSLRAQQMLSYVANPPNENFLGSANSDLDYYGTISLMPSGPAFALPAGFTINCADLNIVDNQWTPPPSAEVPSLHLWAAALMALLLVMSGARVAHTARSK